MHQGLRKQSDGFLSMERWYVAIIVYYLGLGGVKITLLLQCRRLFAAKIYTLINWVLAIVAAWSVAVILLNVFACWPIPYCKLFCRKDLWVF